MRSVSDQNIAEQVADELRAAAAEVAGPDEVGPAHAEALVRRMLAVDQVFPAEIRDHAGFRDAVVAHTGRLLAGYQR